MEEEEGKFMFNSTKLLQLLLREHWLLLQLLGDADANSEDVSTPITAHSRLSNVPDT